MAYQSEVKQEDKYGWKWLADRAAVRKRVHFRFPALRVDRRHTEGACRLCRSAFSKNLPGRFAWSLYPLERLATLKTQLSEQTAVT
jgi:hypothetical protein